MKKALSILLMVVMLVSLSAAAFAAPSPEQGGDPTPNFHAGAPAAKPAQDPALNGVKIVAEDTIAIDAGSDAAVAADLGDTDAAAQSDAKNALTLANVTKALDKKTLAKGDGKTATCTNPQLITAGKYPCFVKYTVDHHVDTVMLFIDGAWEVPADLEIVDNADGSCTISFTLEGPAFYTDVAFK